MSQALVSQTSGITPPSLPELCEQENLPIRKLGSKFASSVCINDACVESTSDSSKFSVFVGRDGRWRYKCLACGIYGDSADFLALAQGITLAEALTSLYGSQSNIRRPSPQLQEVRKARKEDLPPAKDKDAIAKVMAALKAHAFDDGPRAYLKGRGLCDRVIDTAIEAGQLRMLPTDPVKARKLLRQLVGDKDLVAAGFLKPDKDWPAIAFKPLVCLEPTAQGAEFRIAGPQTGHDPKAVRYGSMEWPWFLKRHEDPRSILVVEGFIDTLSVLQSVREVDAVLGVPGVNGWTPRWFQALYGRYPSALLMIGFDNDEAGNLNTKNLVELAGKLGFDHMTYQPPPGLDWNDVLQRHKFL